jgi:hypothetical protein
MVRQASLIISTSLSSSLRPPKVQERELIKGVRKDLNYPPTAVGGILTLCGLFRESYLHIPHLTVSFDS